MPKKAKKEKAPVELLRPVHRQARAGWVGARGDVGVTVTVERIWGGKLICVSSQYYDCIVAQDGSPVTPRIPQHMCASARIDPEDPIARLRPSSRLMMTREAPKCLAEVRKKDVTSVLLLEGTDT